MGGLATKIAKNFPPMRLDTRLRTLTKLFDVGNKVKSKMTLADRAHAIGMEDIAAKDWHEQLLVIVAHVKAFFRYSKDKQDELIKFAEAPSGAHTEETSERGRA
jgi:hypothetical protein